MEDCDWFCFHILSPAYCGYGSSIIEELQYDQTIRFCYIIITTICKLALTIDFFTCFSFHISNFGLGKTLPMKWDIQVQNYFLRPERKIACHTWSVLAHQT